MYDKVIFPYWIKKTDYKAGFDNILGEVHNELRRSYLQRCTGERKNIKSYIILLKIEEICGIMP